MLVIRFWKFLLSVLHACQLASLVSAHTGGGLLLQCSGRPRVHILRSRSGGSSEAGEPRGPHLLPATRPLPHRHG